MSGSQPAIQKMEAGEFNPYHRWLGIRGAQTPPNHYRLLSVELWEADEEIIRDAFSRQSNHVRQFRTSAQRELCEQMLEELKNARDTLLDSRLKAAYDRWLKLALAQQPADARSNSPGQPFTVHGDPLAANSRAVACARCGTENSGNRKFCGGCGAELYEPCIDCGVLCGPGELHCGGCGVNIAGAVQKHMQKLENALSDAAALVAQGLTDIAVQTVEESLSVEHPRLEKLRARAEAFIAESQASKTHFEQLRQSALFEAGQLESQGSFEQAATLLNNLPAHLHNVAVESLLATIHAKQTEATMLRAEIQQALVQKQFTGLQATVNRLLELKPEPQIQKLQAQLIELEAKKSESRKKKLTELANAEIAQQNYAQAAAILEQIADNERGPELEQLLEKLRLRAAEVEWLRDDLRLAVGVNDHSLPIAQRLAKLQSNDGSVKKIIDLIQQRLNPPADAGQAKPAWPRKPAKGHWGFPIETISGFQRVSISQQDSLLAKDPGGFAVAVGLALQGLNQAPLDTNLAPREKTGLLGKLTAKKRSFKIAWGIDIGQSAVKAVQLGVVKGTEQVTVLAAKHVPIVGSADSDSATRIAIQTATQAFLDETDLSASAVCVSFPTRRMVNRMFDLPPVDGKKIPEIMQYEVKQHIPLPLDTVAWDYQVLDPTIEKTKEATIEIRPVALFGAKLEDVHTLLAPFTERKITVDVLQSDCAALYNFCHYEQYLAAGASTETSPSTGDRPVLAVLEIGASSSNVVVTDGHSFATRGVPLGGNDFSRALAKGFQLNWPQAEKLKHNPTAAAQLHLIYEAWAPIFEKLLAETWQPIDHFLLQDARRTKFKLLLAGGGIKLHGLLKHLYHGQKR